MSILIPVSQITDNPWNTRQSYDEEYIEDLADDIRRNGLLQPPMGRVVDIDGNLLEGVGDVDLGIPRKVQQTLGQGGVMVQLAFGHSRLRAHRRLSLERMAVELRVLRDERMATLAWTENAQRKDLTPIEEALAIQKRIEDFDWTQQQVAETLGIGRSTVANKLRLLKLPDAVLDHVRAGELSERQALAMLPVAQMSEEEQKAAVGAWGCYDIEDLALKSSRLDWSSDTIRSKAQHTVETTREHIEREKRKQANARKLKEQAAAAVTGDDSTNGAMDVLTLEDLSWNEYDQVSDHSGAYNHVEGCSLACKCRTQALDRQGEIVPICIDPKHRKQLKSKATRAKKQRRREEAAEKLNAFRERYLVDGNVQWTPAAVRLIAKAALYTPNAKDIRAALDGLREDGLIGEEQREALDGLAGGTWSNRAPGLDALEELEMETSLRLMLEALLQKDLHGYIDNGFDTDDYEAVMADERRQAT